MEPGGVQGWAEMIATLEQNMETRRLGRCIYADGPFREQACVSISAGRCPSVWRKWGFQEKHDAPSLAR